MPLIRANTKRAISENISELVHSGRKQRQAVAIALNVARKSHAHGGDTKTTVKTGHAPKHQKAHWGPIHSHVAGRTDHLPMHVLSGSYVIPADIISGMGEGNTMAGFKVAKSIFSAPTYGDKKLGGGNAYGAHGLPYGGESPHKAAGGSVEEKYSTVPVVVAGGEFVIPPWDVEHHGDGNMDDGHQVLDHFVTEYRKNLVKTLKKLPGPKVN